MHRSRIMGQDVVVYRTRSGLVRAINPFCPHLGAHLGYGGRVEGDAIVCPFHGFAFGPDGSCIATGYDTAPPKASLDVWPVCEALGLVFVWHHSRQLPPQWPLPTLDEYLPTTVEHTMALDSHPQEMLENVIDRGHFIYIHKLREPRIVDPFTTDGHTAHVAMTGSKSLTSRGPHITAGLSIDLYGQTLTISEPRVPRLGLRFRVIAALTVDEPGHVLLRTRVSVRPRAQSPSRNPGSDFLANLATRAIQPWVINDIRKDRPIWNTKIYLAHPRLAPGDGPVMRYRRWADQFYPQPDTEEPCI